MSRRRNSLILLQPHFAGLIFAFLLLLTSGSEAWEYSNGENIIGRPFAFEYETKIVDFSQRDSTELLRVEAKELSLRSKQRLLINEVFLRSYPENPAFPKEKLYLFALAFFAPMAALIIGFWVAGMLLAGKVNPLRAVIGCAGGWVLLTTFVIFYLFFAARLGGGSGTILMGCGIGLVAMSVFVSAVYQCGIFKGLAIFLAQIFVAVFLSIVGLAVTESVIEKEKVEAFWDEWVFEKVGMF